MTAPAAVRVSLTGSHGEGKFMLLDKEVWQDVKRLLGDRWSLFKDSEGRLRVYTSRAQAKRAGGPFSNSQGLFLARWIMRAASNQHVYHLCGDTLDLTKANLSLAPGGRRGSLAPVIEEECARVPLLGAAADGQCATVLAFDWTRISRFRPDWHLLGEGRGACVAACHAGQAPMVTSEILARLLARADDGWAARMRNDDATDLRRSDLYIEQVATRRGKACSLTFVRPRCPQDSRSLPATIAA